jgi:DNA-binding MarR family transcriptional regulator
MSPEEESTVTTNDRQIRLARRVARQCIAVRSRAISRVITGIYDDALRPFGMTTAQMNILVTVAARNPIQPTQLAKQLCLDKSTLSRNLDRMRECGWVSIERGTDGRSLAIACTRAGGQLLEDVAPAWRSAQRQAERLLQDQGAAAVFDAGDQLLGRNGQN